MQRCNAAAAALTTPPPVETPKAQGAKGVGEREFGCLINPVVHALEREVMRAQSEWCQTQEGSREGYGQVKGRAERHASWRARLANVFD